MSAQPMEIRMARLEGAYEQINHRLGTIESQIAELRASMDQFRASVDQKFLWMIGLILVSIILPLVQHYAGHTG